MDYEKEYNRVCNEYIPRVQELEEENRKLRLHIEAKDKAYIALLKDYEELKEKNKEYKDEIEQRLKAISDLHIRY